MKYHTPKACKICKSCLIEHCYSGLIRDGAFGNFLEASIYLCKSCGCKFLDEEACLDEESYSKGDYRNLLKQNYDVNTYRENHNDFVNFFLNSINEIDLKNKVIADIGCGGGAILDRLSNHSKFLIGIEPDIGWSESLIERGYFWFPSIKEANKWNSKIDLAISSMVIEHVLSPIKFINEISELLSPKGILVLTTPNCEEILMDLVPNDFKTFFYRRQHRWYFSKNSLYNCIKYSNMEVIEVNTKHRWGISNVINWCKEKKPNKKNIVILDKEIDHSWKKFLENANKGDTLFLVARKKKYD